MVALDDSSICSLCKNLSVQMGDKLGPYKRSLRYNLMAKIASCVGFPAGDFGVDVDHPSADGLQCRIRRTHLLWACHVVHTGIITKGSFPGFPDCVH